MSKESHAEHGMHGTVTKKYYNTVRVLWADGATTTDNVMDANMAHIFTQAQLDKIEEEKRMAAAMEEVKKDNLKRPYKW